MSEYTPGPWKVQLSHSGARIVQSENAKGPKAVIICSGFGGNRANARLIATAPDLLALLVAASEFYDEGRVWTPEFAAKVEAAIAKATEPTP